MPITLGLYPKFQGGGDNGHRVKVLEWLEMGCDINKKSRSFSKEFKQNAVTLVTEHGHTYAQAGRSGYRCQAGRSLAQ